MFVSPAFSTPTRPMTSPQPSPFTPPTNFNKVTLSDSPAQQQRQGVSSKTLEALQRGWRVLFEEINDSQLLGDMPFFGEGFNVSLRSLVLQGKIATVWGLYDYIQGCHDFLHNGGKGIGNATDESSLLRFFDECVPPQDGIKPEDRYAPLSQFREERKNEGFRSLDLAEGFETLSSQVKATLEDLTTQQKALLE